MMCPTFLYLQLGTNSHTALKHERFTIEVLEVGVRELNANAADLKLRITEVTCRGHLYVSLECFGICVLEVLINEMRSNQCSPRLYSLGLTSANDLKRLLKLRTL